MELSNLSREQLLEVIKNLEATNAELKKRLSGGRRSIFEDISNGDKVKELFSVSCRNGKLYRSTVSMYGNFATFYANIFRAMNPIVVENKQKGTEYLRYKQFSDTSDSDYEVYKSVLEACIDIVYEGKKKLSNTEEILPTAANE